MSDKRKQFSYHQILASSELGGAGLVAMHTADFLQQQDQRVTVWVPGDGVALRQAATLGLEAQQFDLKHAAGPRVLKAVRANWIIGRNLRCGSPGIAHLQQAVHYRALRLGLRLSGLRTVVHVHLEEPLAALQWALQRPPKLIITCARFLVDHVRRALPVAHRENQRIVAVPNAVDIERFCPKDKLAAKQRLEAPLGVPLLLMLANLAPHKGQETAIRAVAALKRRGKKVMCWLAGVERGNTNTYTARLHSLINELDVGDQVQLLGQRRDAPELLQAADVFLLPSTSEGLPLSVLEAQASKVAVVAAPTAGIPEVVRDGETGFLVPADQGEVYASRIEALQANSDLYRHVTERAYEQVTQEYNWRTYCCRIWELYKELLAEHIN